MTLPQPSGKDYAREVKRMTTRRFVRGLLALTLLTACGAPTNDETVAETALALDVCGETVPANRFVDGIPAYAQCEATMNSSIWSNNGVDTSVTSLGPDWVQTQRSGGYQCTELVYRYMRFRWNVSYRSGDAHEWCDGELPANLVKSTTPVHGDLIVFAGGVCGADASTGHIAVVDTVDAARGTVTIVEENRAGRRSVQQSCATCFLHATANDGSMGGAGGSGAGAAGGGVGGAGAAGNGGAGGVSVPPTGGTGGAGSGTSGAAGSPATGGSGGSGAPTGGAPAGGTSADAGSGPSSTGGTNTAGTPAAGTAGVSGAATGPAASDDTLESGCSVSGRRGRGDEAPGYIFALGLALAFARTRKSSRSRVPQIRP
jgi:hypothetical protein